MIGALPKALTVNGKIYSIYSDYRVALLIFSMCNDDTLNDKAKTYGCIQLLYKHHDQIPNSDLYEAEEQAKWFLDGGDMPKSKRQPKPLINWDQDEGIIFPALNKVAGKEIREIDYMHWWTVLGLFNEIGEGLYSNVINIRYKLAHNKKLSKGEQDFYRNNKELIDIKVKLTAEEQDELDFINNLL